MSQGIRELPAGSAITGLRVLRGLLRDRSLLVALRIMRDEAGDIFRIPLPGFSPVVVSGPKYLKFVLLTGRENFDWRPVDDPVTKLLHKGVLVVDGPFHDYLRRVMDPTVNRSFATNSIPEFLVQTERITGDWLEGGSYDMLDEMRKIALLILVKTVFAVDLYPDLERLFDPIVRTIEYISPGLWIVWPQQPRPGYREAIETVDTYLYSLISERRRQLKADQFQDAEDLLSVLARDPQLDDRLVRDQMLTMLIAGHDTSTALLAWTLYLITQYPQVQNRLLVELGATSEDDFSRETLDSLTYLDCVIKESMRLFPPIHVGNRIANRAVEIDGYHIPAGTRVMYSIYLTHRDPKTWDDPDAFIPERFERENRRQIRSYSYVPFGAGPRMCIGAAFAQVESKVILAYLLRNFTFEPVEDIAGPHMGATLEPEPGVMLRVHHRRGAR